MAYFHYYINYKGMEYNFYFIDTYENVKASLIRHFGDDNIMEKLTELGYYPLNVAMKYHTVSIED